jgi:hypothetical protein
VVSAVLPQPATFGNPLSFTILNQGPGIAPFWNEFSFSTDLSPLHVTKNIPAGLYVTIDGESQLGLNSRCSHLVVGSTTCNVGQLAPGESVEVTVTFLWKPNEPGPHRTEFLVQWAAAGYQDLTKNNSGFKRGVYCVNMPAKDCKLTG